MTFRVHQYIPTCTSSAICLFFPQHEITESLFFYQISFTLSCSLLTKPFRPNNSALCYFEKDLRCAAVSHEQRKE